MKKNLLKSLFVSLMLVFSTSGMWAQAIMPDISVGTTEHWYYIVFQRYDADLALQYEGEGEIVVAGALTIGENSQLWKLEVAEEEGYYVLTAKDGSTIYYDEGVGRFMAGNEVTGIKLVASTNTEGYGANAWELQRDGSTTMAMNPFGGSQPGKQIGEWNLGDGGNPVKFINSKVLLSENISIAQNWLDKTKEGETVGTFPEYAREELEEYIMMASEIYADEGADEYAYLEAINVLETQIAYYLDEVNYPETSSSNSETWYYVQGLRPTNSLITDNGGEAFPSLTVVPDDTQLWKFVAFGGGFAMQNKATGNYIQIDAVENSSVLPSVESAPNTPLTFVASDIYTDKVARFWIETGEETPAVRLHAGSATVDWNLMNYNGNRYDNSSFLVIDQEVALSLFLGDAIAEAKKLHEDSEEIEGEYFGQVPASVRVALASVIEDAELVNDNEGASDNELSNALTNVLAAVDSFKNAKNLDYTTLLSDNEEKYSWYRIRNKLYKDVISITADNKIKTTTGTTLGADGDEALWRFELNETGDQVRIINKATGLAIQAVGPETFNVLYPLAEVEEGTWFVITPLNAYLLISEPELGVYDHLHSGAGVSYGVVRWTTTADASHWRLEYVKDTNADGTISVREITVTSSDTNLGTVEIIGETETTVETDQVVDVHVNLLVENGTVYFKHWENAANKKVLSYDETYTYADDNDVELVAIFGTRLGEVVTPTIEHDKWYYIYSAYRGVALKGGAALPNNMRDTREYVLSASAGDDKLVWRLAQENDADALWTIVDEDGVVKLKNRATDKYMFMSKGLDEVGDDFEFIPVEDSELNQYHIKSGEQSNAILYINYTIDRWGSPLEESDQTTWYFVESNVRTSVKSVGASDISIFTVGGLIQVTGSDLAPQVYTLTGAQVDARKALNAGVYIVKVGDYAQKVLVK